MFKKENTIKFTEEIKKYSIALVSLQRSTL